MTFPLRCAFLALLSWLPPLVAYAQPPATTSSPTDLDAFMGRVLERRDENWKKLHDYILSETERFDILGPGEVKLHGMRREFTWYVRDGFLIRSPVRFDGVDIPEPERRRYEERWLKEEKSRESRRARKAGGQADEPAAAGAGGQGRERPSEGGAAGEAGPPDAASGSASLDAFVDQRGEPRFISEAYFLRFTFEPGNYYVVGREQFEGRDVVRIEYYPTRLFEPERERTGGQKPPRADRCDRERAKERDTEREYERKFNKVALVTLWIDPAEYQIVKYTFDNVDFGFLPARWLVRLDEARASMTMARVFENVWLPRQITMRAALSLASGTYRFEYTREFYDWKKAEVKARIRSIGPGER